MRARRVEKRRRAVTFLFTDIEGSTSLLQALGDDRAAQVFEEHRRLLRVAFSSCGGHVIETQGDAFLVGFQSARDAMLCAVEGQRALHDHPWPKDSELRVRMGLNTLAAGRGMPATRAVELALESP